MKTVVVMKGTIIHHCEYLSQFNCRVLGTLARGLWTHCSSVSSPPKWGRSCSACVAAAVLEMAGVAGERTTWISPLPPFQPRATHAWTRALAVTGDQFHSSALGGVNCEFTVCSKVMNPVVLFVHCLCLFVCVFLFSTFCNHCSGCVCHTIHRLMSAPAQSCLSLYRWYIFLVYTLQFSYWYYHLPVMSLNSHYCEAYLSMLRLHTAKGTCYCNGCLGGSW